MEPTITSSDIAQRLQSTRDELSQIAKVLAAMPVRKEAALGSTDFDERVLAKIESEEAALTKKRDLLEQRIPLLAKQAEAEDTRDAQLRIYSLVDDSALLRQQYDTARTHYDLAVTTLKEAIDQLSERHEQLLACHDEQTFLLARFSGLERRTLSSPGDFPALDELTQVFEPLRLHPYRTIGWNRSVWSQKLYALESQRHEARQRESRQTIPGHVRTTLA